MNGAQKTIFVHLGVSVFAGKVIKNDILTINNTDK